MSDWMFYGILAVIVFIAVSFFRRGQVLLSVFVLAIGGWVIYSDQEKVTVGDLKSDLIESIDEAAKSEYEKKGIGTKAYDYNKSLAK